VSTHELAIRDVDRAPAVAPHEAVPPKEVMQYAQAAAREIVDVARSGNLLANVGGREYPLTECMTLIGRLTGHTVRVEWSRKVPAEWGIGDGWEARAVVMDSAGREVAAAESMCLRSERAWSKRDEFAVRSMAQTRASGKALRLALGYIVTLAGWEALPAEEITDEMRGRGGPAQAPRPTPGDRDAAPEGAGSGPSGAAVASERLAALVRECGADADEVKAAIKASGLAAKPSDLADDLTYASVREMLEQEFGAVVEAEEVRDA
jgi:hypothetical protein